MATIPAIAVLLLYETFLGHRHDYSGHYAAGYGATFFTLMLWLRMLPPEWFPRRSTLALMPLCIAAILVGAVAEATAFRIAKFDEIDFFNQSLGAVLATIAATAYTSSAKPQEFAINAGIFCGIVFLSVGGVLAVA